jgi:uncharacterized repeat protein (TIGR01451 family)
MDLYQDTANTATVTGTFSMGDMVDIVSDTHTISVDVINPGMAIHKTANPTVIDAGGTVTYTYIVTNSGDGALSNVNVNDDKCAAVSFVGGDDDGNSAFDPDEAWIYTCSMVLTATTINTGTATGTDSAGGQVRAIDTAFVNVTTTKYIYLPVILKQTHLIE